MFRKRVEALDVYVDTDAEGNTNIFIKQPDPFQDEPSIVMVSPDQIDLLIGSLKEAKESLNQN